MTTVLHLITDLDAGGTEMMLFKLLSRIDRLNFKNIVVSMTDKGALGSRIEALGVPVYALNMKRSSLPSPIALWSFLRILRYAQPQILQTWLYHSDLLGLLAGKISRVPIVVWNIRCSVMQLQHYSILTSLVLKICAKLSGFPNAVLTNSLAGRSFHENFGYHPKRWEFIPNGFDTDIFLPSREAYLSFRQSLGLNENTHLVGLIARFDAMKDHATFLSAAGILNRTMPDVHFILAGKGVDNSNIFLTNLITGLNLSEHVHLLGESTDIPLITAALDIAVSSSFGEGFSNAVGEAMACGVPCVVTDCGDSAHIVGDTGIVVPRQAPEAMAKAWDSLLAMPGGKRQTLGRAARKRIVSEYSLGETVQKYEKLYKSLCVE